MPKIRKQKKKKTFKHTINRKKLNKKRKRLPKIKCEAVKEAWDIKQTVKQNLNEMGLSTDPNVTLAIPKTKDKLKVLSTKATKELAGLSEVTSKFPRIEVAAKLEQEAAERRRKTHRLSQMQVDRLGYFIQKYGNDYRAMTRDRLNYDQHTWRQLRMQIKKFMAIKAQWDEYWTSIDHPAPDRCVILEEGEDDDD